MVTKVIDMGERSHDLPSLWRKIFWLEIPIVGGTILYWLVAPQAFLRDSIQFSSVDSPAIFLLYLYAGTVFSLVFWFYLRLLLQSDLDIATFRLYQQSLAIGDVIIVVATLWYLNTGPAETALLYVQIGMATLWGGLRTWYLAKH